MFEPAPNQEEFFGSRVSHDEASFLAECDVILANRMTPELESIADKVVTRDLFGDN